MRARRTPRTTAARLAVGATVLAFPATAVAVTTSGSATPAQSAGSLHAVHPSAARYGHETIVHGSAPASAAGTPVALEYRPAMSAHWRTVGRGHVRSSGRFAVSARMTRSGSLQVVALPGTVDQVHGGTADTVASSTLTRARLTASKIEHLTVKPKFSLVHRSTTAVVGRPAEIRGQLLPAVAGRKVVLDVEQGRRWIAASHARTHRSGAFSFRYAPGAAANQHVRVSFAGDRLNSGVKSSLESVTPMQYAEVSWYEDAGSTACGFHATYGIASRTLPCGTRVTMSYSGRTVVATVDDRGPFVYSRLYDLNQTVAGKLGMYGVATVLASI